MAPKRQQSDNARRQAAYRARHLGAKRNIAEIRCRLNMAVEPLVSEGLKRRARHYGTTQVTALARIVQDAEHAATRGTGDSEVAAYYADITQ